MLVSLFNKLIKLEWKEEGGGGGATRNIFMEMKMEMEISQCRARTWLHLLDSS